jgi:hypothetical protein
MTMSQFPTISSYNLTTAEGLAKAIEVYAKENPGKALAVAALSAFSLPAMFGMVLVNKISKSTSTLFEHPEKAIKVQRQAAIDIIKAGKDNGASKVRVTLNQKAGIDIGGALEGCSMKFSVGTDDNMTIEVEYK